MLLIYASLLLPAMKIVRQVPDQELVAGACPTDSMMSGCSKLHLLGKGRVVLIVEGAPAASASLTCMGEHVMCLLDMD